MEPTTRMTFDSSTGMSVERIVVPVTLDHRYDRGVSAAAALAERFDLPMRLVCVDLGTGDSVELERGASLEATRHAVVAAHPALEVDDLVLTGAGDPAVALAGQLEDGDLVVLATEAMEGPAGSFAQHLVGNSSSPVLMFGPAADLGDLDGDVMVAVDGSVLAERSIPAAFGFASALGSNITLVEVVSSVVSDHVRRLKERGERVSENAYIRDLAERLDDRRVSWKVVHHDDPALALSEAAREADAAMIVMSTHGREGFVAQVFNSIALETVRYSRCPVLVRRPVSEPLTAIAG